MGRSAVVMMGPEGEEMNDGEEDRVRVMMSRLESDEALAVFLRPEFSAAEHLARSVRDGTVAYALENAEKAASLISAGVRAEVIRRQNALLAEVEAVGALEREVAVVADGVNALAVSTEAMIGSLQSPYEPMALAVRRLENLQTACDLIRKVSCFRAAMQRLRESDAWSTKKPMDSDTLALAAESAVELDQMLHHDGDTGTLSLLERVDVTRRDVPLAKKALDTVRKKSTELLHDALRRRSQGDVGVALYALHALGHLDDKVRMEVTRLTSQAHSSVSDCFDPRFSTTASSFFGSGVTSNSTDAQGPRKKDVWERFDAMSESVSSCFSQLLLIEVALEKKHDPQSHRKLRYYTSHSDDSLADAFLVSVAQAVSESIHGALNKRRGTGTPSLHTILTQDYPRLRDKTIYLADSLSSASSSMTSLGINIMEQGALVHLFLRSISLIEQEAQSKTPSTRASETKPEPPLLLKLLIGDLISTKQQPRNPRTASSPEPN